MSRLTQLPNELISKILYSTSPPDILPLSLTCKLIHQIAKPLFPEHRRLREKFGHLRWNGCGSYRAWLAGVLYLAISNPFHVLYVTRLNLLEQYQDHPDDASMNSDQTNEHSDTSDDDYEESNQEPDQGSEHSHETNEGCDQNTENPDETNRNLGGNIGNYNKSFNLEKVKIAIEKAELIPAKSRSQWITELTRDVRMTIFVTLLLYLPNLQELTLPLKCVDPHFRISSMIESISEAPGHNLLSRLKKVTIYQDPGMALSYTGIRNITRALLPLPSLNSLILSTPGSFDRRPARPCPPGKMSNIMHLACEQNQLNASAFCSIISQTHQLKSFAFRINDWVPTLSWRRPCDYGSLAASLVAHAGRSLEVLKLNINAGEEPSSHLGKIRGLERLREL